MSIRSAIHCDGCHREQDWHEAFRREHPPVDWFYVMSNQGEDGDDWHACSWDCLTVVVHRYRPIAHDRVPMRIVAS